MTAAMDPSTGEIVGSASDVDALHYLLDLSLKNYPGKSFKHMAPILGRDRSIRVLGQHPFEGSIEFPRPISTKEMARELVRLTNEEARYPLSEDLLRVKGWEIRKAVDDRGDPIVKVYAVWVSTDC